MRREGGGGASSSSPKKIFSGIRFVLVGFDSVSEAQYKSELVDGGGVDVGLYDFSCTHVIVSGRVFDEPVCVAARTDGKILVTGLWIDDSLELGMLADFTKVLYQPVRDLSGIPGSESLHICLTGYQRQERDEIMKMVSLMGGRFSKPLIANQVTHLICYKFEGEKYELAKKVNIKLVNHKWLEDCLKAWDILPIDNYTKSGCDLEMLEAEAMDTEEENEAAGRKFSEKRGFAEPRGDEMFVTIASGLLADDTRNLGLQKNVVAAKPSDLSANNRLFSTPCKENIFGNATGICDTKSKVHKGFVHEDDRAAEHLPDNYGMLGDINRKQSNTSDIADLSMTCNSMLSSVRNSCIDMTSCEETKKLNPLNYSGKTPVKVVLPEEQSNIFCTPHKGKLEEVKLKGNDDLSSFNSKVAYTNKCIADYLHGPMTGLNTTHVEGKTQAIPQKRKLSVSSIGSKLLKVDQISRTSCLQNAPSNNFAEQNSLMPRQCEPDITIAQNEASASICFAVKQNDALPEVQKLSVANNCQRSPELAQQNSRTCTKHNPSTSPRPEQFEFPNAQQYEIDQEVAHINDFEGTALVHPKANQHGSLSKSGSLSYKRKSSKNRHSAAMSNVSNNSSSTLHSKDGLLSIPPKPPMDGTKATCGTASDGGTKCSTSPDATLLSNCPLINEPGQVMDRISRNDGTCPSSLLASDGGSANEAPISVKVLGASLKSLRKSKSSKSKGSALGMKCTPDMHSEATEQHDKPAENQEVLPSTSRDTKVRSIVSSETLACKQSKANEGSRHRNSKVVVSRNLGCRFKPSRENSCKSIGDSFISTHLKKSTGKLGNGKLEFENEDIGQGKDVKNFSHRKEKAEPESTHLKKSTGKSGNGKLEFENEDIGQGKDGKNFSHRKEKAETESNSKNTAEDKNYLDPEKENKLKDCCHLSVNLDEDFLHKVKKNCKPLLGSKSFSGDNSNLLPKSKCLIGRISDPVWFILSGHRVQRKEFQIIIRMLRGKACRDSHHWSYQATHFIVPDPVRRTEKFFAAAAAGRWILRSDYLTASSEAGKFLDEEPFEWYRNGLTEDGAISLEAPRKWRTLRERTGHGALYGMRIIIYGESIAPTLDTLKRVVKAGDGTILATCPPYTRFLKSGVDYAIVNASMPCIDIWVQEFLRHEIPCVLADYLVEYVCKPGYSLERHVLYKTHTWAEKSFSNLLSHSEEVVSDNAMVSNEDSSDDLVCVVCCSRDKGDVMLICGNEAGTIGCGIGTHIYCCDPPLESVPEDDWFCPNCSRSSGVKNPEKNANVKPKKKRRPYGM